MTEVLSLGPCGVIKSHYNLSNSWHSEWAVMHRHHRLVLMEYCLTWKESSQCESHIYGCYIVDIISDEKQIKIRSNWGRFCSFRNCEFLEVNIGNELLQCVALIEATGNSTKLICGYLIHVSSTTINYQFFLAFRKVLSYRKKERSLLLINVLETLPVM